MLSLLKNPRSSVLVLVVEAVLLATSCGQEIRDECAKANGRCPPCSSDSQCVIRSQPCYDWALCVHRDVEVNFTTLGCNYEHKAPDDDECRCVSGECRSEF